MNPTYASIADLPLRIDSYSLEGLQLEAGGGFTRLSTVIRLAGAGHEGLGEDVTYNPDEQIVLQQAGPILPLVGAHTIETFSRLLEGLELFPEPPVWDGAIDYRRWGYESAALDLALRQAGLSLAGALGRELRPVRFCASMGLGDPPSAAVVRDWLAVSPELRFKLDATVEWDDALVAELAATGAVDVVDLKGHYADNWADFPADAPLYRRVAEDLPGALIEDARLDADTDPVLEPYRDRLTWDAPIHRVDDIRGLAFPPQVLNFKPSRFGSVRELFAAYDYCHEHGIAGYGGGQFELGVGRAQIQYLASLFHPDGPNDVAPSVYNEGLRAGLPQSPLPPPSGEIGFR